MPATSHKEAGLTPDRDAATQFLRALDPTATSFTFQSFDDDEERKESRGDKPDPFARIRHGTLDQHWSTLVSLNERGAGIFVCVNETDFKGRARDNIVRVRHVFADLDGAPLAPVIANGAPMPRIINETSPGRWHAYWPIKNDMPLDQFETLQRAIAAHYGGDPSVNDLPRVMRLPGIAHRKDKAAPFLSRIEHSTRLSLMTGSSCARDFLHRRSHRHRSRDSRGDPTRAQGD